MAAHIDCTSYKSYLSSKTSFLCVFALSFVVCALKMTFVIPPPKWNRIIIKDKSLQHQVSNLFPPKKEESQIEWDTWLISFCWRFAESVNLSKVPCESSGVGNSVKWLGSLSNIFASNSIKNFSLGLRGFISCTKVSYSYHTKKEEGEGEGRKNY